MKECKTCGEEIKAKALKCPHCQTSQSKWAYDRTNIKHILISTLLIFGIAGFFFLKKTGVRSQYFLIYETFHMYKK